mmetsp:Transcript_32037/g.61349  ORF Transcript_32037/g.61349 Transcript_32037/m.61349 type:complete len:323 (+) Transcript_32037:2264-3232(+)
MIAHPHAVETHGPLAHAPQSDDLLDGLLTDLEGRLGEYVRKIGIPPRHVLAMRRQMRTNETQGRIVELKSQAHSPLVSHDAHDAHSHTIRLHVFDPRNMWRLHEHANQQSHQILLRQRRVSPHGIPQRILTRIQSAPDALHPKRTTRLTLILHRDIHRIQIHHLLKSHHHDIGRTVFVPIGAQPARQALVLAFRVDVPRADEHPALLVLGEFVLTRTDLFVDPGIAYFGGGLAVADASVFGFFVGGAVGNDHPSGGIVGVAGCGGGGGASSSSSCRGGVRTSGGGGGTGGGVCGRGVRAAALDATLVTVVVASLVVGVTVDG